MNTTAPVITGTAMQGSTLSASPGTWTNGPTSYAYQWQQCPGGGNSCQNVPGQTSSTYPVSNGDVGSTVRAVVVASNGSGSASATSAPAGPVAPAPSPPGGSPGDPVAAAVGDIACGPTDTGLPCKQSATATLAQSFSPSDVFVLGDNQYESGSLSEYNSPGAYNATWGVFNPIVHPVPGNHEYLTSGAAGYFSYFGQAAHPSGGYYSFTLGTWHIVALNSNCSDQKGCSDALTGGTTSAQTSWLRSDLAANTSPCVLAMWHHPLFSSGWTGGAPSVSALWSALYSVHADVVLNGHDHLYERYAQQDPSGNQTPTGIREFVVGTGGESLNGISNPTTNLQAHDTQYGVLVLTLHASSYSWEFVTTGGTTTDSGTATCHGAGGASATVATAHIARAAHAARLNGPRLSFDALPVAASLRSVRRAGLAVAVHSSRAVDVTVTTWLRQGHQLRRIATAYETESEIPKPYSQIVLHLPSRRLRGRTSATLIVRFAAVDSAGQRRTVTRTMSLR